MPRDAAEEIDMPPGGARNRSGPQPDENSLKSARIGYKLTTLPAEGYDGEAPAFPLHDDTARELELWAWVWTTPQACAWIKEPWRHRTVALWVRWSVRMEDPEAPAALGNVVVRLADQVGMTPAGLKENGWKVAADQLAERRAEKAPASTAPTARDRLKAVRSAAAGK
jgi:hypothetical protein